MADLERQLASARKQLEEETLQKVDLENKVQSLKVRESSISLDTCVSNMCVYIALYQTVYVFYRKS